MRYPDYLEGHRIKEVGGGKWVVDYVLYRNGIYVVDGLVVDKVTDEAKAIAKEKAMAVWGVAERHQQGTANYFRGMLDWGDED